MIDDHSKDDMYSNTTCMNTVCGKKAGGHSCKRHVPVFFYYLASLGALACCQLPRQLRACEGISRTRTVVPGA